MSAIRSLRTAESGQAVVEVAIFMGMLCLLMLGVIDIGRLAQFDALLARAARAGAQYGAQNLVTAGNTSGMQTAALNDATNLPGVSVTATSYCSCYGGSTTSCTATACSSTHRLQYVSVSATATFHVLFIHQFANLSTSRTHTAILQVAE
jgi:Flp pilus assembly protein TadG